MKQTCYQPSASLKEWCKAQIAILNFEAGKSFADSQARFMQEAGFGDGSEWISVVEVAERAHQRGDLSWTHVGMLAAIPADVSYMGKPIGRIGQRVAERFEEAFLPFKASESNNQPSMPIPRPGDTFALAGAVSS